MPFFCFVVTKSLMNKYLCYWVSTGSQVGVFWEVTGYHQIQQLSWAAQWARTYVRPRRPVRGPYEIRLAACIRRPGEWCSSPWWWPLAVSILSTCTLKWKLVMLMENLGKCETAGFVQHSLMSIWPFQVIHESLLPKSQKVIHGSMLVHGVFDFSIRVKAWYCIAPRKLTF